MMITKLIKTKIKKGLYTKPYQNAFIIVAFAFLLYSTIFYLLARLSIYFELLSLINICLFFAYSFIFLGVDFKNNNNAKAALKIIFALSFATLFLALLSFGSISQSITVDAAYFMLFVGIYFLLFILIFFVVFIGIYLYRAGYKKFGYLMLIFAIVLIIAYFYVKLPYENSQIDDEMFIAFAETNVFAHGLNPYGTSVSGLLYSNFTAKTIESPTFTTTNLIVGVLNYPALFFLATIPFYYLSGQNISQFGFASRIQAGLFLIPLLFIIIFYAEKKHIKSGPIYSVIFFIAFFANLLSSPTNILMLALLILAYVKLENRYVWLLLGICASLQELLWLPVMLLIIYSMNNQGLKRGICNLFGAILVFLIINSYFIALSPVTFLHGVFNPLGGGIFARYASPIGHIITVLYGTQISVVSDIFIIATLVTIPIFIYFNKKRMVGIFSLLPFAFLAHDIAVYAVFFMAFIFVTLFIKDSEKPGEGVLGKKLREHKELLASSIVGLALFALGIVVYSHALYSRSFNITVNNGASYNNISTSNAIYAATIGYKDLANNTIYVAVLANGDRGAMGLYGFFNQSIVNNPVNCTGKDYVCRVNVNKIELNKSSSNYQLVLHLDLQPNETLDNAQIILYNGEYIYASSTAKFSTRN